jgi:SAM-dependent methyltransferase
MSDAAATAVAACWACGAEAARVDHHLPGETFRCAACGLVFQPRRAAAELREIYDETYFEDYAGSGDYSDEGGTRAYEARRRLRLVRRHVREGRLLEIGAAEGHFLEAARASGFAVRGIEPAESAARAARARAGVEVETGFVEDVELEAEGFDAICAWHVLEHVPEPAGALERLRTALRGGGVLFLEVPNAESPAARAADWPHWAPEYHVAHYGPASLRALLERAGMAPVAIDTFPGTGYYPPRKALAPGQLLSYAREAVATRGLPRRPHPTRHELLRAVARRAA